MKTSISQSKAESWARALYADAVDQKNAAGFAAVFDENATLRFGNNEPLVGRSQIESAIAQFFQAMVSLRHEFAAISRDENTIFLQANVTYTRHDGKVVTVPAMTVFVVNERDGDLVATACRIYVDLSPLFAPSQA
ncbi:MAG: nuclear transport factor 2 family protein [Bryobacteraceae bacterium]